MASDKTSISPPSSRKVSICEEDEEDAPFIRGFTDAGAQCDSHCPSDCGQINLAKLKKLRQEFNWENENDRYPFYLRLTELMLKWRGKLPNLNEIFRKEEMDWFIWEAFRNRMSTRYNLRGKTFMYFVERAGYKDIPELDKDGNVVTICETALHKLFMASLPPPPPSKTPSESSQSEDDSE